MSQPPSPESKASTDMVEPQVKAAQTSNQVQAFFKTQSIKVLRGTIQVLEEIVVKLEPPSTKETPILDNLWRWWIGALGKIRSSLPVNLSSKLSNSGLTAIVLAVIVALIWTTSAVLSGKPTQVANVPIEKPTEVVIPTETSLPVEPKLLPELTAPQPIKPVKILPPPVVELTPEQKLIASIQDRVAKITDQYADGLIQSIDADFEGSNLTIKVGDDWYSLEQPQQDKLAARMLERAKELDFSHLQVTDTQGILLARSPVVGNDMVILRRQVTPNTPS